MTTIYAVTILGSPAAECAKYGICKIERLPKEHWEVFQPAHVRHAKARIFLSKEKGGLSFEFPLADMRPDTYYHFFASGTFRVDAPGHLPENVASDICIEERVILPKVYQLIMTDTEILLEVDIAQESPALGPGMLDVPTEKMLLGLSNHDTGGSGRISLL